ncbi:MAG: DUF2255 family protein [Steroidobacteraceae bacterium]|jgi:hypothetical protein
MSKHFDQSQLRLLDDVEEIEIETRTGLLETDTPQRTVVWVVVVDEDVYVRSVNGELAHWYQHLTANPVGAIYADDRRLPIHAAPALDPQLQLRVSEAYLRKYRQYPQDAAWLIVPTVLATTLRLDPEGTTHEHR